MFRYEAGRRLTLALLLVLTLAGVVFAAQCGPPASAAPTPRFCGEQRLFGYIRSLKKSGSQYLLRFDPAFFLSAITANQAAAQDGVVPPGQPVPNDNYVVNESRRTYVYKLTPATRIRVLLRGGNITEGSPVSLATLVSLVHGGHLVRLFEGFQSGFWLGVHIDRACSLEQQYRP